ncbi:MAG: hypothetical protein ACRDDH_18060 [Cetobacterium sp.]|uniref:hypothetical protein n=1 Tax=Cetobacterium sp. TaxID=2071632 RepID=UPI003EE4C189
MAEYFFGNKDIKIIQQLARKRFEGRLRGILIVTDEKDIPLSSIYDFDSIKKVEAEHSTAKKLIEALKMAFTQKDKNKNQIKPTIISFFGSSKTEVAEYTKEIEAAFEEATEKIYGIVHLKSDDETIEWAAAYPKNVTQWFSRTDDTVLTEKSKSNKVRVLLDENQEWLNAGECVKTLWNNKFSGLKFQMLVGATPIHKKDGEVTGLDEKGIACYRYVNGEGEISNSLTTDGKNHLDTTFIMDSIKYLLASNINIMFKNNDVNSSNVRGLTHIYSKKALDFAFEDLGMIEKNIDFTPKYIIVIPEITGKIRETRDLRGVKWKFVPNVPIEGLEGTVYEVLDEIELTAEDLI